MQSILKALILTKEGEKIIYPIFENNVYQFSTAKLGTAEVKLRVFFLPINYFISS